ncbi:MAG: immunoglobulin domain-containing family protein [Planctomycetota bacterium]|jgi:hypothetical protein
MKRLILALLLIPSIALARDVTMEWDAVLENGVPYHSDGISRYELYFGPTEGNLNQRKAFTAADLMPNPPEGLLQYRGIDMPDTAFCAGLKHQNGGEMSELSNVVCLAAVPAALPVIVTHPVSVALTVGESTVLTVSVTGTGPFTYTWEYKAEGGQWVVLTDRTGPSNEINNVTLDMDGTQIRCVISNSAGPVTSDIATLTVNPVVVPPLPPPVNFRIISEAIQGLRQDIDTRLATIQDEIDKIR